NGFIYLFDKYYNNQSNLDPLGSSKYVKQMEDKLHRRNIVSAVNIIIPQPVNIGHQSRAAMLRRIRNVHTNIKNRDDLYLLRVQSRYNRSSWELEAAIPVN
ncbi:MAG: hypothetical protein ACFFBD_22370, partial [Candidatus Hodarchaeota archaeon]